MERLDGIVGVLTGRGPACDDLQRWLAALPLSVPAEQIVLVQGNQIAWQRNLIVARAMERVAPWVLYVDADCVPGAGVLQRLLSHDLPLVSGACLERSAPFDLCAVKNLEPMQRYTPLDLKGQTEPFPVVSVGTGCLLVRQVVWAAVGEPWFRCGQVHPALLSEDLDFCLRASEAGCPPYLDPLARVGHSVEVLMWPGADGQVWAQWSGPFGRLPYKQPLFERPTDDV
jgi:hypothetical protein